MFQKTVLVFTFLASLELAYKVNSAPTPCQTYQKAINAAATTATLENTTLDIVHLNIYSCSPINSNNDKAVSICQAYNKIIVDDNLSVGDIIIDGNGNCESGSGVRKYGFSCFVFVVFFVAIIGCDYL